MTEKLKYYLRINTNLDDYQLDTIVKCFIPKIVKRNTILLSEGEICKEFYFVNSGYIRTYYLTKQGHEKTRNVAFDCSIATSISSFISLQPTSEFVEVLDDSELFVICHKIFYQLVSDIPEWAKFYKQF